MNNGHLALVCVFTILLTSGCSPRIDRPAITDKIRKADTEVKRFLNVFPDADVSLHTARGFGEGFPDPRDQIVTVRSELSEGMALECRGVCTLKPMA